MPHHLQPGDYLVFQLESGYGLLRVLAIDGEGDETVWHLAAYGDLFLDVDSAEAAVDSGVPLSKSHGHLALTNRAFESTQVARIKNVPVTNDEAERVDLWRNSAESEPSDRSVRLLMGLR